MYPNIWFAYHKISDLPHSKRHIFYKKKIINIYNLYFLFLYIIVKVKKNITKENKSFENNLSNWNFSPVILWYDLAFKEYIFISHPKYYKKTYIQERKNKQTKQFHQYFVKIHPWINIWQCHLSNTIQNLAAPIFNMADLHIR